MIYSSIKIFWDFLKKFLATPKYRSMLIDRGLAVSIRETIEKELNRRGWSRYRLVKELKGAIPANTVYDYLRGKTDIGSERVSIILQALGLRITHYKSKSGQRPRR